MRFVVLGAGAIGGVLGAGLFRSGHDVCLVGRRPQVEEIRENGLRLETPDGDDIVPLPALCGLDEAAGAVDWDAVDAVLLCVKSQDTHGAVRDLARHASSRTPLLCVQNGVTNEDTALRHFDDVYGVTVACPAAHLRPGVVQVYSAPVAGAFDIGRHPRGTDAFAERMSRILTAAGFTSRTRGDVTAYKYGRLVTNLGGAVEALCGPQARGGNLDRLAMDEARTVLQAAGVVAAHAPRNADVRKRTVHGRRRPGGPAWQSLYRRTGRTETDYLNGEIVRIGRLHGLPAPVNAILQREVNRLAAAGGEPGSVPELALLRSVLAARRGAGGNADAGGTARR